MSLGISHEKIAGPMSVSALLAGGINSFPLTPRSGGRLSKFTSFMVVVLEVHGTAPTLGFIISHGPNGSVFRTQSSTTVAAVTGAPLVFGGGAGDGATVELGETRKPF